MARIDGSTMDLKERVVAINRVSKTVKGGRIFKFAALVVVGDGNGTVGFGIGKAGEVPDAIRKGIEDAKKNLVKVPVLKGTVPHEVETSFGGAKVLIKPAAAGTGLKAGGAMRAVLESVGIKDVIAKSKGSSNAHNLVKATIAALAENYDCWIKAELCNPLFDWRDFNEGLMEQARNIEEELQKIKVGNIVTINRLIEIALGLSSEKGVSVCRAYHPEKHTRKILNLLYRMDKKKFLSNFSLEENRITA